MKKHESIDKKVDKLFREKSKKNENITNYKNYNYNREKISKQIMKLKAESKINYI